MRADVHHCCSTIRTYLQGVTKGVKLSSTGLMNSCLHVVQGCTALHHAAWHAQLAVLKMLLSSGAHVNLRNHKVSFFIHHLSCLSGRVPTSDILSMLGR